MSSPDPSKYVVDLTDLDVLCGRGSGPNDRTGNIEFRNLILTRKAEYLAAKTREVKGRIASEIVNNVRLRGGRFLKKLTPDQAKKAGFGKGVAVYELADEPTVLEKAKQTLRQNRAAFEKKKEEEGGEEEWGQTAYDKVEELPMNFNGNFGAQADRIRMPPPPAVNHSGGSSASMNFNPIPLDQASYLLDSDKLPQMASADARHLQNALFASSSISSKDVPSTDQMKLSMDLSVLLGSMGSNSSGVSNMSAEGFGLLIKDLSAQDQASLIQQYKALQDQQQQALMQQYEILKIQHKNMVQNMYPQFSPGNSNEMNMNFPQNMNKNCQQDFSQSMFDCRGNSNEINFNGQQNFPPQGRNFPPQCNNLPLPHPELAKGSSISSIETSVMNNFSEDSLSRHHNTRNSDGFSLDVFRSLMREYQQDSDSFNQRENSQYNNMPDMTKQASQNSNEYTQDSNSFNQHQNNHYNNMSDMTKQTSQNSNEISQASKESYTMSTISEFSQLSNDPVITNTLGSIARQQEFNDQQKLLQQYASLHFSGNQVSEPIPPPNQDNFERPIDDDGIVKPPQASLGAPYTQKRPSRRQQKQETDQSLTLSFVTGKSLASKLNDDPMNTSGSSIRSSMKSKSSSASENKMSQAPRDSSLLSLMSMSVSLSEISHDLPNNKNQNPGESLVTAFDRKDTIEEGQKESSQDLGIYDMSLASLGEGWALDESVQRRRNAK